MRTRIPCSQKYLPVEEKDEYEGEEEGGAGGKDLVGQLLAHLVGVYIDTKIDPKKYKMYKKLNKRPNQLALIELMSS